MSKIVCYLTKIARCGGQYRNRRLEPWGIRAQQAGLLLEICATPGISQDALARRVFLDKSVVARALANLEEQGLVERPTCQKDRRVIRLHPTEKALQLQPRLQAVSDQWAQHLTAGMTPEELAALDALLTRLQERAAQWEDAE